MKVTDFPFSQTIGTCITPSVQRLKFGPATETGMCCSNFVNLSAGLCLATISAWFSLINDTEQQLSRGKGRDTPAEVTLVHKMFFPARLTSKIVEPLGRAVISGFLLKSMFNDYHDILSHSSNCLSTFFEAAEFSFHWKSYLLLKISHWQVSNKILQGLHEAGMRGHSKRF